MPTYPTKADKKRMDAEIAADQALYGPFADRLETAFIRAAEGNNNLKIYLDDQEEMHQRIDDMLAGFYQMMMRTINAQTRLSAPLLEIKREGEALLGRWKGVPMDSPIDITGRAAISAMRYGEFHSEAALILAKEMTKLLAEDEFSFCGFERTGPSQYLPRDYAAKLAPA